MGDGDERLIALQAVADAVPGLVAIIDRAGKYQYNNQAFEEWFGAPRDQLRGRHIADVLGTSAFEVLEPYLQTALGGRPATFETTVPYRDGTRIVRGAYLPQVGQGGEVERVVAMVFDMTAHTRLQDALATAEVSARRNRFLAQAGEVLASSLQYEATLNAAVRLAIPELADWAGVDILDDAGTPRRLAIAATDPEAERLGWEMAQRYPTTAEDRAGVAKVLRTGQPELYAEITDQLLSAAARDEEHARILRGLAFRSALIVPLNARGRTFGALWFATTHSGRVYGLDDVELATRVAERAALAVDNARLYSAAIARGRAAGAGERARGHGPHSEDAP
jgi:PAS domain S-box-containing protein